MPAPQRCYFDEARQDLYEYPSPTSPRTTTKVQCVDWLLPIVKNSHLKVTNKHWSRRKLGASGVHRNLTRSENRLNGETNIESIRVLEGQIRERERTVTILKLALTPLTGVPTVSPQST